MIYLYKLLFFLILCVSLSGNEFKRVHSSYEGTHFFVGYMQNENKSFTSNPPTLLLYFFTRYETEITVKFTDRNGVLQSDIFNVGADVVFLREYSDIIEHIYSEQIESNKTVEVITNQPITLLATNSLHLSSDAYSILPTNIWGNEYYTINMPNDNYYLTDYDTIPDFNALLLESRGGQFLIMAAEDDTEVTINPNANTARGNPATIPFTITMNKGDSYLVQSQKTNGIKGRNDLSGTRINSTKPVGVISGHVRTSILQFRNIDEGPDSKDHVAEMLPPTKGWGREYLTMPYGWPINSYFKLVAFEDTFIEVENRNSYNVYSVSAGQVLTFENIQEITSWRADKPFLLVQFMARKAGRIFDVLDLDYDPAMNVIPPLKQMINRSRCYLPNNISNYLSTNRQFTNFRTNVIADSIGMEFLTINGTLLKDAVGFEEYLYRTQKYYHATVSLYEGGFDFQADSGKFYTIIYAHGRYDSYSYAHGTSFNNPQDETPPEMIVDEECGQINIEINEIGEAEISGLFSVMPDLEKTYNYLWEVEFFDNRRKAKVTAKPEDITQEARFYLEAIDYNGNGRNYDFFYEGFNIDMENEHNFGAVDINTQVCYDYVITNNDEYLTLNSISLPSDLRIEITNEENYEYPVTIERGESLTFKICFNPESDFSELSDSIKFDFNCGIVSELILKGEVLAPSLNTIDYDFGSILIGDTVCVDSVLFIFNNGNLPITLNEINYPINQFLIDTLGYFPITLDAGDTLWFETICFTPIDEINYFIEIDYSNNLDLGIKSQIIGKGVRPNLNNIFIDFGETRVGVLKQKDTLFTNTGEYLSNSLLNINEIQSNILNDVNISELQRISPITLAFEESESVEFIYQPSLDEFYEYNFKAFFIEDWSFHDTIWVELRGQPTIPEIRTKNIVFDTITAYTSSDTISTIIYSEGNELLTIDGILPNNWNQDVFRFDINSLDIYAVQIDDSVQLNIEFHPDREGLHEMILVVRNDAMPNYERKLDTIYISGYARRPDTLSLQTDVLINQSSACLITTHSLILENKGNIDFIVSDITILGTDYEIINFNNNLDTIYSHLNTNFVEANILDFSFIPLRNSTSEIIILIHGYFNNYGDTTIMYSYNYSPFVESLTITKMPDINIEIGQNKQILIEGTFPYEIDTLGYLKFEIYLRDSLFHLVNNKIELNIFDEFDDLIEKITLNANQSANKIIFENNNSLYLGNRSELKWNFSLELLALLHQDTISNFSVTAYFDECFNPAEELSEFIIDGICIHDLRPIQISDFGNSLILNPNIIRSSLNIEFEIPFEKTINFEIIDGNGKKIVLGENLYFDKGKNYINFNIEDYVNGNYILVLRTDTYYLTKKFIISK